MSRIPVFALVSDYGTKDHYVASVKAAVLKTVPNALLVDVGHDLDPANLLQAAFFIERYFEDFPTRTIHLCVVDPGVGSDRRALIVVLEHHLFVGPDNGIFTLLYRHPTFERTYVISEEHYVDKDRSMTFDGRDLFARVGARLALLMEPTLFGPEITDPVVLPGCKPVFVPPDIFRLTIVHVDRFGNLITNLKGKELADLAARAAGKDLVIEIGGRTLGRLAKTFSDVPKGELLAYIGSSGYLEFAVNLGSASGTLGLQVGGQLHLKFTTPPGQ